MSSLQDLNALYRDTITRAEGESANEGSERRDPDTWLLSRGDPCGPRFHFAGTEVRDAQIAQEAAERAEEAALEAKKNVGGAANNIFPLFEMLDVGGDRPGLNGEDPSAWGFTLQSPFCDPFDKILYFSHEASYSGGPRKELIAIRWSEKPSERVLLGRTTYGREVAHQNNALYRPFASSAPTLIMPYDQYSGSSHTVTRTVRVYRHSISDGAIVLGEPLRELTLWGSGWTPDTLLRFCVSADSRYMISEAIKNTDGKKYVRVWDAVAVMSDTTDDISDAHIVYEYERPEQTVAGGQGIFSDGSFIYSLSGSTVTYMSCMTIDGKLCWTRPPMKAAEASAEYSGATYSLEPEGVFWAPLNGQRETFYYTMAQDPGKHSQYFCMSIAGGHKLEGQDSVYEPVPSRQARATDRIVQVNENTFGLIYPEGSAAGGGSTWHYDSDGLVYTRKNGVDTPHMVMDLDLATEPGWYHFDSGTSSVNRPFNNTGYLHVIRHSFSSWSGVQIAYRRSGSNRVAKRSNQKVNGELRWRLWAQVDAAFHETWEKFQARQQSKVPHIAHTNASPTGKPLLVVVAGQSNAAGSSDNTGDGNIFVSGKYFKAGAIENYSYWNETVSGAGGHTRGDFVCNNPQWIDGIQDPVWPSSRGGFIPALAEHIAEERNRPLYVINVARNGSNCCEAYIPEYDGVSSRLIAYDINPVTGQRDIPISGTLDEHRSWAPSGWLRNRAKAIFDKAVELLGSEAFDFLGTIWLQGEYDALYAYQDLESLADYKTTLADTLDWLNSNIKVGSGYGTTYVLPIGYDKDTDTCPPEYTDDVNAIIDDVVTNYTGHGSVMLCTRIIPEFISVEHSALMRSSWHYNQAGYDLLGYALAENIKGSITSDTTPAAKAPNIAKSLGCQATLYFNPHAVSLSNGTNNDIAGECNVIKVAGKTIMIDVGGTNRTASIKTYLADIGVTKVDYLILSHYHADHVGNITQLSGSAPANSLGLSWAGCKIYLPSLCDSRSAEYSAASTAKTKVEAFAAAFGATTVSPAEGDTLTVGGATLTFLNCGSTAVSEVWEIQDEGYDDNTYYDGPDNAPVRRYHHNDYSMCVDMRIGDISVFYAGDLEYAGEKRICDKGFAHPVDLLKFQHHGSNVRNPSGCLPYYIPFADMMPAKTIVVQNGTRSDVEFLRGEAMNWKRSLILSPNLKSLIFECNGKALNCVQYDKSKAEIHTIVLNSGVNEVFNGDDLNDYVRPGTYTVMSSASADTMSNTPKGEVSSWTVYQGKLVVGVNAINTVAMQMFFTNDRIYLRYGAVESNAWNWRKWWRVMTTCPDGTAGFVGTPNPVTDNSITMGSAGKRWKEAFVANATINTSDERLKTSIGVIPDDVLDAWENIGWAQFQMADAVAEKGAAARLHTGLVAQRIRDVFSSLGLDAARYGLFCYDEWPGEEAEYEEWDEAQEDGTVVHHKDLVAPATTGGNRYSIRYAEALAMEAACQRRRADRIEQRLAALEAAQGGGGNA